MAKVTTPAYVNYLAGELEDALDAVYKDDATPVGRAYRDKLQFVIQTYCQQHDQAGEQTAAFVRDIPCNERFDFEGAIGGLIILRQTHEALAELLQDDADFKASYRGEEVTDDKTDRYVRQTAHDYEKDTQVGEDVNDIVRRTAAEGEATEKEVTDASYDSDDGAGMEFNIALSARDRLKPEEIVASATPDPMPIETSDGEVWVKGEEVLPVEPDAPVQPNKVVQASMEESITSVPDRSTPVENIGNFVVSEPPRRDEPPPAAPVSASAEPECIKIVSQTYFGQTPSVAFNRAKEWLTNTIIKIAAGSEVRDEFPRIAPLVDKKEFERHGTTREELTRLAREIRNMTRRLRPPLSERHGELMDLMERIALRPGGGGPSKDEVDSILDSFTEMFGGSGDDKYGLGLNQKWDSGNDDE